MTKKETQRRAKIMLAAEYDGDTCVNIECRSSRSGEWTKMYGPLWNWVNFDYRVIPKPEIFYAEIHSDRSIGFSSENLEGLEPLEEDTIGVLKITITNGKPSVEIIG